METQVLNLWLDLTALIHHNRIVRTLPFNQAHVCNLLLRARETENQSMTPTQLCRMTGQAKSLMNRTLKALLEKGLIEYVPSPDNRRVTPVRLTETGVSVFMREHEHSLSVVRRMLEDMQEPQRAQVAQSLEAICCAARRLAQEQDEKQPRECKEPDAP